MYLVMKSNFGVFTFEESNYLKVINNIIKSRFFIAYLDYSNKSKEFNQRYIKYLDYKHYIYSAYLANLIKRNGDLIDINDKIAEEIYIKYFKNLSIIDDYYLEKTNPRLIIEEKKDRIKVKFKNKEEIVITVEDFIYDYSVMTLERLRNFKIEHLEKEFLEDNHVSFILPSFLTKYDGIYLIPIVTLTVYNCGIIILEIIYIEENDRLIENDEQVMNITFKNIKLHKPKSKYCFRDFFDYVNIESASMYNVKNHYYEILKGISGNKILKYENDFLQYSASLAKFNDEKADIISIFPMW